MRAETPVEWRGIKWLLWLYFALLFLEGVLRKWVLPGWSNAIFIARDPLVILIYLMALRSGALPFRPALAVLGLIAVLSLMLAMVAEAPLLVVAFGMRTNYLHLPLIFLMGRVLDRDDVVRFGKWCAILAVPIVLLMVKQFNSSPDAWVNVGVGEETAGQLRGAMGRIRPPGPFSFIAGAVVYFGVAWAFVLNGWLQRGDLRRFWLLAATAAIITAIPVSISRSLLLALLIGCLGALMALRHDLRRVVWLVLPLGLGGLLIYAMTDTVYFEAYSTRWQESVDASSAGFYANVVMRMVGGYLEPFSAAAAAPIYGYGVGMGTIAGARLATGSYVFALAEGELSRVVLELGPVVGLAFVAWRVWLAATLMLTSWRRLALTGDSLPWVLAFATSSNLVTTQWGPTTHLGFAVFSAGLVLGAMNDPPGDGETSAEDEGSGEEEEPRA